MSKLRGMLISKESYFLKSLFHNCHKILSTFCPIGFPKNLRWKLKLTSHNVGLCGVWSTSKVHLQADLYKTKLKFNRYCSTFSRIQ